VANGAQLQCDSYIPSGNWFVHQYSFTSDIKIIPLEHFYFILGLDWLQRFSPIKVHCKVKWSAIPYQGSTILLQGIVQPDPDVVLVHIDPTLAQLADSL
jgi:hypothetical protein